MTEIVCDFYQSRDEQTCPACKHVGITDATCVYWWTDHSITLLCRKCGNKWKSDADMVLDGKNVEGGKDTSQGEL